MADRDRHRVLVCAGLLALAVSLGATAPVDGAERARRAPFNVSGDVALSSLIALGDGYLQKLADTFTTFAATNEARSGTWATIQEPLGVIAERNVSALIWFAKTDGTYWSVQQGLSTGNLWQRDYFRYVVQTGQPVTGPLVESLATGKYVAIVAVPIKARNTGAVIGVLGASVYLDDLSRRLSDDMALAANTIFYSFDATPLLALEWDPSLIFADPFSMGPEIRDAFEYMLAHDEGVVRYRFRNEWRTVRFRRSSVTGWWYALGVVQGNPIAR